MGREVIYCSRGFNSPLSNAEGWSSSNIQFPVRNTCRDCWNMVVYCLYKHKLELFLPLFSWSYLFAVTWLKYSSFVLFSRWLDGFFHGMPDWPSFSTSPVEWGLQDVCIGTKNQRAQQLCGLHGLNLPFRDLGSGWVGGKSGPAQQGRHLWLTGGQQPPGALLPSRSSAPAWVCSACRGCCPQALPFPVVKAVST